MPSHYSDIGYSFGSSEEHIDYLQKIYDGGKDVPSKNGTYRKVVIDGKIEFWIQTKKSRPFKQKASVVGVEFHFSSANSNTLRFESWVEPKEDLSGEAYVWCVYDGGDLFPMVVNMPDADLRHDLKNGDMIKVQLACFAESLNLFDTKEEYDESQTSEPKFSDEYFIPSGTFNPDGTEKKPTSDVMFSGHILSAEKRTNSHTSGEYYYFTVKCRGIIFDVLADTAFVTKKPKVGGILSGSFWVSGKVAS